MFSFEFHKWKASKEDKEQTSYQAYGCAKNKQGETVECFQCNRSGIFNSRVGKDMKIRHEKTGGARIHMRHYSRQKYKIIFIV